ncbi:hypothetical protein ACMS1Z_14165 [Acidiphilium multivorum]|uniref:hypothetical protein n=1 Tax=Acidiphilium multivorum TaxID=62140 RepID=UPI0039C96012
MESLVRRMEGARSHAIRGATPGERWGGVEGFIRLLKTYAAQENPDFERIRPLVLEIMASISVEQSQCASFRAKIEEINQGLLHDPAQPLPNPFRVGTWVYHLQKHQVSRIEGRYPIRKGADGVEERFTMEERVGGAVARIWGQFDIRLATAAEVRAENERRAAEDLMREQEEERKRKEAEERAAAWLARVREMNRVRGGWHLSSIARISEGNRSKLLGQADNEPEKSNIVFEARKNKILDHRTFKNKAAATRYFNSLLKQHPNHAILQFYDEEFDQLVANLSRI